MCSSVVTYPEWGSHLVAAEVFALYRDSACSQCLCKRQRVTGVLERTGGVLVVYGLAILDTALQNLHNVQILEVRTSAIM